MQVTSPVRATPCLVVELDRSQIEARLPDDVVPNQSSADETNLLFSGKKAEDENSGSTHDQVRSTCAYAYAKLLHIFDCADRWLSDDERAMAVHHGRLFLLSYGWLGREATSNGMALWKVRPKHHAVDGMLERIRESGANPRWQHCCVEEDFAGKLSKLVSKIHRKVVCCRIVDRYLMYLSVRWIRRRDSGLWMVAV